MIPIGFLRVNISKIIINLSMKFCFFFKLFNVFNVVIVFIRKQIRFASFLFFLLYVITAVVDCALFTSEMCFKKEKIIREKEAQSVMVLRQHLDTFRSLLKLTSQLYQNSTHAPQINIGDVRIQFSKVLCYGDRRGDKQVEEVQVKAFKLCRGNA